MVTETEKTRETLKPIVFFKSRNGSRTAATSEKLLPFPPENLNPCLITETTPHCWAGVEKTHPRCFYNKY